VGRFASVRVGPFLLETHMSKVKPSADRRKEKSPADKRIDATAAVLNGKADHLSRQTQLLWEIYCVLERLRDEIREEIQDVRIEIVDPELVPISGSKP
jgi:hypothetical protein